MIDLDFDTDGGSGRRARLGLIVLQTDETVEDEIFRLVDADGVVLHCSRIPSDAEVNPDTLAGMAERLPAAADLLPHVDFGAIGYGCTSAATIIGPQRVADLIRSARPGDESGGFARTPISEPLTAVRAACAALGIRRLGFVSPYEPRVTTVMREALTDGGLTVTAAGSFGESDEYRVARISTQSVHDAILRIGREADCDGVFASCTNLRTLPILEAAERELGVPVISSNQALAWHMLRSAGITDPLPGRGRLLTI